MINDQWLGWQASDLNVTRGYAFMGLARRAPAFMVPDRIADSIQRWTAKMAVLEQRLQTLETQNRAARILTEDKDGLRVRYEASLGDAKIRLTRAFEILEASWIDEGVTSAVKELSSWLDEFGELVKQLISLPSQTGRVLTRLERGELNVA